ncbi:hypothetical protein ACVWXL_003468 [Bradyrhizobium sp. GM22.5]
MISRCGNAGARCGAARLARLFCRAYQGDPMRLFAVIMFGLMTAALQPGAGDHRLDPGLRDAELHFLQSPRHDPVRCRLQGVRPRQHGHLQHVVHAQGRPLSGSASWFGADGVSTVFWHRNDSHGSIIEGMAGRGVLWNGYARSRSVPGVMLSLRSLADGRQCKTFELVGFAERGPLRLPALPPRGDRDHLRLRRVDADPARRRPAARRHRGPGLRPSAQEGERSPPFKEKRAERSQLRARGRASPSVGTSDEAVELPREVIQAGANVLGSSA